MATQAKTAKENKNYKPAHVAMQPAKRKTDTRKIIKAVIFGPTIAILGVTLIYLSWWGIAKAFMALHAVVTAYFVPWVGESWPIIIGAWAIVALTSVVYYFVEQYQKENKKEKKAGQKEGNNTPKANKQTRKAPTSTIFDAKPDTEFSAEELEEVGGFPYIEDPEKLFKEMNEIFTIKEERKNPNPDNLISLGKPSKSEPEA